MTSRFFQIVTLAAVFLALSDASGGALTPQQLIAAVSRPDPARALALPAPALPEPNDEEAARQAFLAALAQLIPNWISLYDNERFVEWLNETDPKTGQTRKSTLLDFAARYDAVGAATILREGKRLSGTGDWVGVVKSEADEVSLMNRDLIRVQDGYVLAWELTDLREPKILEGRQHFRSTEELWAYDCTNQRKAFVSGIAYSGQMGRGEVVFTEHSQTYQSEFSPVVPGSVGAATLEFACRNRPRQVE
jgi:hypothetical protein